MSALVSLGETKDFLALIGDDWDAMLITLIESASDTVREYATAWNGTGDVPARIKVAVLTLVAAQFETREKVPDAFIERLVRPYRSLDL
ncbi:MAG: hypothetical protein A4S16_13540 [Proteobacteria bacterium SG_bin6]|nr:MAG: hypothetical protein A4S16_13540 [Proteobacteria bacterium SG_bin6]